MHRSIVWATAALVALVPGALVPSVEAELLASDGAALAFYGSAVSLSADGTRAIVGANGARIAGRANQGAAYVLVRTGASWTEEGKLVAPDGASNDYFGSSVALSADGMRAIAGAPQADVSGRTNQGAAYVYLRTGSTWALETKLTATNGTMSARFGEGVSFSTDATRVLVGAQAATPAPGRTFDGAAYVYFRSGTSWTEEAMLSSTDGTINANLGASVSLSSDGTRAVAGAPGAAGGVGSAYVFVRSGTSWTQEARLRTAGGLMGEQLGRAVAMSTDATRVIVSAPSVTVAGHSAQGAAYVFVRSVGGTAWAEEATLVASDGGVNDYLGNEGVSLALSADGSRALVGVSGWTTTGAAYLYSRVGTSWTEEAHLSGDATMDRTFGASVALTPDGARALVGDTNAVVATIRSGNAWSFTILDTSAPMDAGVDGGSDAGSDAGTDGGSDAGDDGGTDAGEDGGMDAGSDAGNDAAIVLGSDAAIVPGNDAGHDAGMDASSDAAMAADAASTPTPAPGCACRAAGGAGERPGGSWLLVLAALIAARGRRCLRSSRSRWAGPLGPP